MRKIWEQMQGNEFQCRHAQAIVKKQRKRNVTDAQKQAKYVLTQMHAGREFDIPRFSERQQAAKEKRKRMRDAFNTLRRLGMV